MVMRLNNTTTIAARTVLTVGLVALLAACDPGLADPPQALQLVVSAPLGNDNPFLDPKAKFVALTAEGPQIVEENHQIVLSYTPGMKLDLGKLANGSDRPMPYGAARQFRLELYPAGVNGTPALPILGHGRTVPISVRDGDAPRQVNLYVTRVNTFAPPINANKLEAKLGPPAQSAGVATAPLPDGNVLIAGGSAPKPAATDPWDPNSYTQFQTMVLVYNTDQRQLLGPVANLSKPRAFATASVGVNGLVAISGGYVDNGGTVEATSIVEYFDPKLGTVKQAQPTNGASPHLKYARAKHSITRMFDNENFFLICGGKGPKGEASNSWEIWHPTRGAVTQGPLSKPRWNHATVRVPDQTGGYIMLIGGENSSGVLNDFEVIRYDDHGNVAYKGNKRITCSINGQYAQDAACDAAPPGGKVAWEPIVRPLAGNAGRTLAASAYVAHAGGKFFVYMVGGFEDTKHTKPIDRIDVYDLLKGNWVPHDLKLAQARGGAQIGVSGVGRKAGQVLITGGIGADGKTVATGEVVHVPNTGKLTHSKVGGTMPGGGRVLGSAVGLVTGHVLVLGGVTFGDAALERHIQMSLWAPL